MRRFAGNGCASFLLHAAAVSGVAKDAPICKFACSFLEAVEAPGSPAANRRAMVFQQDMERVLEGKEEKTNPVPLQAAR